MSSCKCDDTTNSDSFACIGPLALDRLYCTACIGSGIVTARCYRRPTRLHKAKSCTAKVAVQLELVGNAPDWIRTSGLVLRRDALYPAELRARQSPKSHGLLPAGQGHCPSIWPDGTSYGLPSAFKPRNRLYSNMTSSALTRSAPVVE